MAKFYPLIFELSHEQLAAPNFQESGKAAAGAALEKFKAANGPAEGSTEAAPSAEK